MDLRNIWLPADGLAKSIFSTILVDLGQPFARPNILADADTLQFFTRNFTEMMKTKANAQPGPAQQSFEALRDEIGPLEITPSVISTKYLCEVPQRKSMGTLFISIFIADLVLVQAVWKLFSLCASSWHTSRHPEGKQIYALLNNWILTLSSKLLCRMHEIRFRPRVQSNQPNSQKRLVSSGQQFAASMSYE